MGKQRALLLGRTICLRYAKVANTVNLTYNVQGYWISDIPDAFFRPGEQISLQNLHLYRIVHIPNENSGHEQSDMSEIYCTLSINITDYHYSQFRALG